MCKAEQKDGGASKVQKLMGKIIRRAPTLTTIKAKTQDKENHQRLIFAEGIYSPSCSPYHRRCFLRSLEFYFFFEILCLLFYCLNSSILLVFVCVTSKGDGLIKTLISGFGLCLLFYLFLHKSG
ncbi:hypothetical protein ACH5RR_024845 [Cinchona calisaya]|uniref:Uncharacterized protein n=1 Tax=Cinchona calisaya TaxID=153742 RepID=A0ABD2YXY3_9GENT